MGEPANEERSPVERRIERSMIDEQAGYGKPLTRRQRQTRRTVEAYLAAGVLPRYMERAREIETGTRKETARLEMAYRALRGACAHDREEFARRWTELAARWDFSRLNQLIREHNDWYPIERRLPMDPRTRDYVTVRGRSYRREQLGPAWVLERFPPRVPGDEP